jgi:hypothetical protein
VACLFLGLLIGIISGLVFVGGAELQTLPVRGVYGLLLGAMMTSGIAIGLELAERGLDKTHQESAKTSTDKVEKFAL